MTINKKTFPDFLKNEIDIKKLLSLLEEEDKKNGDFAHVVRYGNFVFDIENTYNVRSGKGYKWDIVRIGQIYSEDETGRTKSYKIYP